jgi:hypothetical protein
MLCYVANSPDLNQTAKGLNLITKSHCAERLVGVCAEPILLAYEKSRIETEVIEWIGFNKLFIKLCSLAQLSRTPSSEQTC